MLCDWRKNAHKKNWEKFRREKSQITKESCIDHDETYLVCHIPIHKILKL